MVMKGDEARFETGPDQQRPKVSLIVIHLMIVHFDPGTKAKTESGKLQEALTAPGWNIDQKDARRLQYSSRRFHDGKRIAQMFQD